MQIIPSRLHIRGIANAMVRESPLPHRKVGSQPPREAALDQTDRPLQRDLQRSEDQMNVVRHHDECVQFVSTLTPIVLQSLNQ